MRTLTTLLALAGACQGTHSSVPVTLQVEVQDERPRPLPEVMVELDEQPAAKTDGQGRIVLSLQRRLGSRLRVRAACPDAYRALPARTVRVVQGGELALRFQCLPQLRTLVVVVNAPRAPGAWVRADGEPLGRVGHDGTLHAILKRPPHSELRLLLDTSASPRLRPQSPIEDIVVPDRDEIIVFNPALTVHATKRRTFPAASASAQAEVHVPYAIRKR